MQLEVYTFNFSLLFISYFHLHPRNYLFVLYICKSVSLFSCLLICFISSIQFSSSVVSDFCGPTDCSMQVFPVHPQFPELVQIHVHQVSDAIQRSHSLSSPDSCLQSFPASGSFPVSQFFASGGQSIGVSASASVFPMNIQNLFPLGWTGWISLQSKGLSRVFSNTTVQKHQFFGTQLFLQSNSHIHT